MALHVVLFDCSAIEGKKDNQTVWFPIVQTQAVCFLNASLHRTASTPNRSGCHEFPGWRRWPEKVSRFDRINKRTYCITGARLTGMIMGDSETL